MSLNSQVYFAPDDFKNKFKKYFNLKKKKKVRPSSYSQLYETKSLKSSLSRWFYLNAFWVIFKFSFWLNRGIWAIILSAFVFIMVSNTVPKEDPKTQSPELFGQFSVKCNFFVVTEKKTWVGREHMSLFEPRIDWCRFLAFWGDGPNAYEPNSKNLTP